MVGSPFILIPAAPSKHASSSNSNHSLVTAKRPLAFKPPAHKHAHHIHSIPPSSTSTRALILEQTLSHLADIRLAAARAQIGWGGITNQLGPESVRHRHEFYNGFTRTNEPLGKDGRLAANLDSKAKGISNVLCAMLAQEPAHRSPQQLPNDVRFRLALAILLEHYFAPSAPELAPSSKEKKPEIPLELAPFVSLSSYRPSSPSAISRPSHPTLPSLKSLNLAVASPPSANGPQSPFASFSASGVSPRPVKPLFFGVGPSSKSSAPPTSSPKLPATAAISEKEATPAGPVPVFRWPSQDRGTATETPASATQLPQHTNEVFPKTMTKPTFMWSSPSTSTAEREKSIIALWDEGLSSASGSNTAPHCTRHLRRGCQVHICSPSSSLPRNERSTIGAGLDSRRSRLDIFSDATESEETRARMLNVLTEFIRLSALVSSAPSSSSGSHPRKEWFDLLALILTRAVLEGYVLHGWRGTRAAQILFGFGGPTTKTSSTSQKNQSKSARQDPDSEDSDSEDEDEEAEFSPDGYPRLWDACSNLFPSIPSTSIAANSPLKELRSFREEMGRRRMEFLSPASPPSSGLEAHLNSLNEKYPAEELDKKMIEFIERIAESKGGAALERSKGANRANGKAQALDKYFQMPSSAGAPSMDVDASSDDSDSTSEDDAGSQSEDDSSADERTPTTPRVTSSLSSSKRPRAPSLSDDAQAASAGQQSSHPPSKRERLVAPS